MLCFRGNLEPEQQSNGSKGDVVESKEWIDRSNVVAEMKKLDEDYFAQATKNPKRVEQLKEHFNKILQQQIEAIKQSNGRTYLIFSQLFDAINQSQLLNIHRNPRIDAFFKIKQPAHKQVALGFLHDAALEVFNEQIKAALLNIQNDDQLVTTITAEQRYKKVVDEIKRVAKLDVFSLRYVNWSIFPTGRDIQDGVLAMAEKAMKYAAEIDGTPLCWNRNGRSASF